MGQEVLLLLFIIINFFIINCIIHLLHFIQEYSCGEAPISFLNAQFPANPVSFEDLD